MMESVLAAQSQASPTLATSPARTVISEAASSAVPATTAHFAPTMPARFPWGMPASFVPEDFAPTLASLPVSRPVLSVRPPVVHTLPRVEDTIYHSEPSEGPNIYEKMEKMKDQFLELHKELKNLRGKDLFGKNAAELCLVPNVKVPVKFKVPDFEKYKGNTCRRRTKKPSRSTPRDGMSWQLRMIASAPSDFTEMVNMGMRLEESVREGRLSREDSFSAKRYGGFAKKKEGEAYVVSSHIIRRPSVKRKNVCPVVNQHQVDHITPAFREIHHQQQQHCQQQQAYQPRNYNNTSTSNYERKRVTFDPTPMTYAEVYPSLIDRKLITPRDPPTVPTNPQ
ncbi:hypothetical protein KIW84_056222 [Lathyrus oleraceus]|uniref:Uncharacterized protein n=1 Tax=Pisum sativum TaxID=3888 RepID=A0A9D4WXL5_PEA|nr:hypothetical protein KIW84_056222 [Pisum sativum]